MFVIENNTKPSLSQKINKAVQILIRRLGPEETYHDLRALCELNGELVE